ncbi:hypothetical protein PDESU_01024 [Pontiella desulfatans]|uniref:Outer membrane protein beta-barrel domain-containing protein n=1 Tax=Pontiella desulfatans TaxID=2750659 RepID=A0A6C2TYP3_PONDE|nr:hypothetical protein [Pontiella desulfatans]VGO12471.1 hypothetical protein PDESU_01024 [Pontiella desulfatans]
MKRICIIVGLLGFALVSNGETQEKPSNWHFSGNVVYSSRSLDGTIVSHNAISEGAYGHMVTTGDAMGVDDSQGAMLAIAAQYKRFGIGINYMPTSFEGAGSALVAGSGANAGLFFETPLETKIDVDMLLASAYYNFVQTRDSVFGIGFGLGQTMVDLSISPEVGAALVYDGQLPFGFLRMHFNSRYKRFLYGFALNGLSLDVDGANIVYSDYKVDLGYRLVDRRFKLDLVGGYRLVNFAVDLQGTTSEIAADVSLEGPFVGISAIY